MAVIVKVAERAVRPRSLRKELRAAGQVPGVVYGNKVENTSISVDAHELSRLIRENGQNAVYTLEIAGKKVPTLLYDYQLDTFNRDWVHVEFLAVDMNEETEVEAELTLVGTPKGVKIGGVLGQNLYTIMVSATPDKLPERVEVNVEHMEIGDAITVADIPVHKDYTIVTELEEQVATVEEAIVHAEPEVDDSTSAPVAQPEVIGEAKDKE
ncbi:50S ribosomal protein L25/general stress protein Ctc [Vagococcus salmoninarum]|uniref:Large ribosomal subunit protein bL25 n=1 Tax=Vagococcus salmoninarum TaxID=2739 RepID=A0A429ZCM5_9ENTE|nr:50S ribosomal protein L25/general stress protein Ctc [Vagococcus salmoninarum]MBE9389638.1 50S ribosomal protein L25/general stress protein Ctc [Vagococcus salmoninarum]RST91433.1 50S ribosomal protein L25/general stress protein Ctc [Vagococcus salmoninarum]